MNSTNWVFKRRETTEWPWHRSCNPATITPDDIYYNKNYHLVQPKFAAISYDNLHFDISTRRAAIKASQSVVSVITYSDGKELFQGTGTIIDDEGTILTSAKLIACPKIKDKVANNIKVIVYLWDETSYEARLLDYDFYFSIAAIRIQHYVPQLKPACLKPVDDCVSFALSNHVNKGFQILPHTKAYKLIPGDKVIALGRYFIKPYDLMAAPGEFSISRIHDDIECKELFRANCEITRPGVGGPIINQNGVVIGITSWDSIGCTPFLPLNIALKWLEHNNKSRELPPRPSLGMKMTNLYTADIHVLAKFNKKVPNHYGGVFVEEVIQGSSADDAGICPSDVIFLCCGENVRSFLQLFDMLWDKIDDFVVLDVFRASNCTRLKITVNMKVVDTATRNMPTFSKKRTRSIERMSECPWERTGIDNIYNKLLGCPVRANPRLAMFESRCYENKYLDRDTKMAAIIASPSVVSLVIYSDGKELSQGAGTIIDDNGTILTSAKLVSCRTRKNLAAKNLKVSVYSWDEKSYEAHVMAYDFYYGIAIVKIQKDVSLLKPACLRRVDDCVLLDSNELSIPDDKELHINLVPGDKVIALGRHFIEPYYLMAAPGVFSMKRVRASDIFKCKELFRATCLITKGGTGGPLINYNGEVIGIASYDFHSVPFLPINVALEWWEHHKKYEILHYRPLLGLEVANLYTSDLLVVEKVVHKFPNSFAGVIVEEVKQGSLADKAGLRPNDLVVECCGKPVRSYLEWFGLIWNNNENSVKLVVVRAREDDRLNITMEVPCRERGEQKE